jgi:hypothetical protein
MSLCPMRHLDRAVQDRRLTLSPCWTRKWRERPVLVSVRNWLTPQVVSVDGHCPDSASWFDLESQGFWFGSSKAASPTRSPPAWCYGLLAHESGGSCSGGIAMVHVGIGRDRPQPEASSRQTASDIPRHTVHLGLKGASSGGCIIAGSNTRAHHGESLE